MKEWQCCKSTEFSGIQRAAWSLRNESAWCSQKNSKQGSGGGWGVCLQSCVLIKKAVQACSRIFCVGLLQATLWCRKFRAVCLCSYPTAPVRLTFLLPHSRHYCITRDALVSIWLRTKSRGTTSNLMFLSKNRDRQENDGFLKCSPLFWYLPIKGNDTTSPSGSSCQSAAEVDVSVVVIILPLWCLGLVSDERRSLGIPCVLLCNYVTCWRSTNMALQGNKSLLLHQP